MKRIKMPQKGKKHSLKQEKSKENQSTGRSAMNKRDRRLEKEKL
jgi:hypothetical protein